MRSNIHVLNGRNGSRMSKAMDAPPPKAGEVRRTALPDTFDGIRFEIGRMQRYVQEAITDPVVIDAARLAATHWSKFVEEMSRREGRPIEVHNNKTIQLEGIDIWCRHHFFYLNDPTNREVIQTPRRMLKIAQIQAPVLRELMEPFYRAIEASDQSFQRSSYEPPQMTWGDCDEAAAGLICAMAAAIDIAPVAFRFGGNGGTLHHVWSAVNADGQWYDSDLTEPGYKLGDHGEFDHFELLEIPL